MALAPATTRATGTIRWMHAISETGAARLVLRRPDDWHLHLRDGDHLAAVVAASARQFARALVMPNLKPPVTTTDAALAYRDRIRSALPPGARFEPLMTLYLTDDTPAEEITRAKASGAVQAVVSKSQMTKLLPDDSPKSLTTATGLGAASSSCSYAAVALARSIFRKGADFTAAMAFEIASTNLVAELSIILIVLMGWQFALAEFAGGLLMVMIIAVLFRIFLSPKLVREAREQADKGIKGIM